MQTSTPQAPKPKQPKSILLIGPPGGGKTTLMLQFPRLRVIDCDLNLDGPERHIRANVDKNLSYAYDAVVTRDDGTLVEPWMCFDRVMTLCEECKKDEEHSIIGIDSLTWINEYIIRKILFLQKKGEMEARDWIPFKSRFLELLAGKIRGMGKSVICTVHESIIWSPDPKNIIGKILVGYEPSVQGSIIDYFGAFFTDVWRCECRLEPGPAGSMRPVFYVVTCKTPKSEQLKNSVGLPVEMKNPTFAELNKYLNL